MADTDNHPEETPDYKPLTFTVVVKATAILFVLAIYVVIFLKILYLQ